MNQKGRQVSSNGSFQKILVLLIWSFAFDACTPSPPTDPIFNEHTIMDWVTYDSNPDSPSDLKPLDDLILYLDSSLSMQGYADPRGQFEYALALRAVQSVVDRLEPRHAILFRRVDRQVGPLVATPQTLFAASTNRSFYQGETSNSSNLAGAIRSFDVPEADLEEGRGIARCHILVTDGVQHTDVNSPDSDCVQGSDARCINLAISRLIGRGWGVHLFGVRSRFQGPMFSENLGQWLPGEYVATNIRNPSRYRPFLIYLFTNEAQYLNHLVDRFRRELLNSGINPDLIVELPLSLPLVETSKLQLDTEAYSVVNAFNPKKPYPNPSGFEDGRCSQKRTLTASRFRTMSKSYRIDIKISILSNPSPLTYRQAPALPAPARVCLAGMRRMSEAC